MLANGMKARGHGVEILKPKPFFFRIPAHKGFTKWLTYLDQYLVFPVQTWMQLKKISSDTLFVFTDNALGPWVPLVADRPHVIHCHDFLAQKSALGLVPQNPTSYTGSKYQAYIREGYKKGRNFISVSNKTRDDLNFFLSKPPHISEVVYNGLNFPFRHFNAKEARLKISAETGIELSSGYILHIGGNQWYKNRTGVIDMYNRWRSISNIELPLLLIGEEPSAALTALQSASTYKSSIYFLSGLSNELVNFAYSGASVFLFPSFAEGFGWPIAEAMASGCPVITTGEAPMTEVAADAGFFIPIRPNNTTAVNAWALTGAEMIEKLVNLSEEEREEVIKKGLSNSKRFDTEAALEVIEHIYKTIESEFNRLIKNDRKIVTKK
jgi:glycosyltransferase involved in cell wall biosynthesis